MVFEEHLDLPLEKTAVDQAGSMLGSGAIVVMDHTTDIVKACHNVVRFSLGNHVENVHHVAKEQTG